MGKFALPALLVLTVLLAPGRGSPVNPIPPRQDKVLPYGTKSYLVTFKARERANVIVIGSGASYLGLYVYDEHGNCIRKDDQAEYATRDDCAVEWYPPRTQKYVIEVRNLGAVENQYKIAIR